MDEEQRAEPEQAATLGAALPELGAALAVLARLAEWTDDRPGSPREQLREQLQGFCAAFAAALRPVPLTPEFGALLAGLPGGSLPPLERLGESPGDQVDRILRGYTREAE